LDDPRDLEAARRDPDAFLERRLPLVIDEFQRGGDDLLRAIKRRVDDDPRPGRFLVTGSTRFTTVSSLSESLAGRIALVELHPLSQGETRRTRERFLERLFGRPEELRRRGAPVTTPAHVFQAVCAGGYPEPRRLPERGRSLWFDGYVETVTQRDARELVHVQRVEDVTRLLRILAARTAQELNLNDVATDLGLPRSTLAGYLPLLESLYLVHRVPPWSRNLTSRVSKHPKLHLADSGLAAHLMGVSWRALERADTHARGALLETFVVGELRRQLSWAGVTLEVLHFRDHNGPEVDIVLEARDGRAAVIEVKASRSPRASDFRTIDLLRERLGDRFVHGVLLHLGPDALSFGERRTALPVSALWAP
jgi:predicted AAA+ superfamily ATPase